MDKRPTILFLGYRKKAVQAAKRLGLSVVLWVEEQPRDKKLAVKKLITAPFVENPENLAPQIKKNLEDYSITAVIALTEATVVCAALLRKILNVAGQSLEIAERCHNKFVMKNFAKQHTIPITDYQWINSTTDADELIERWGLPIIVKQNDSSGGRDLTIAQSKEQLIQALKSGYLAEKFISGTEWSIESFIHDGEIIFQNITEYYQHYTVNIVPAGVNELQKEKMLALNQKVLKTFGIERGITHMELFWCDDHAIFGEIAARPPGGYLMNLISEAYDYDAWETFLQCELGYLPEINIKPQHATAAWIIHPGAGKVSAIHGWHGIVASHGILEARCKLKPGMICKPRIGSGEEYAHVLLKSDDRARIIIALTNLQNKLQINMFEND